ASLIPMVLNSDSVPLDLGRSHRLINSHQRKALVARDRGCAFPDCPCPATWCDAHHVRHWADGGATDLANMVLLCRRHHRLIHHSQGRAHLPPANASPEFYPPPWIDPPNPPRRNTLRITRQ